MELKDKNGPNINVKISNITFGLVNDKWNEAIKMAKSNGNSSVETQLTEAGPEGYVALLLKDYLDNKGKASKFGQIPIWEFEYNSKIISFYKPLSIDFVYENDEYILSNDELGLLAHAPTFKSALEAIYDELCVVWKAFVESSDELLTGDGQDLKKRLLTMASVGQ